MLHSFRNEIILQLIHLFTCLFCKWCNNRECVVTQICIVYFRPVAGYISICPDSVSTRSHDVTQLLSTMKHEILHALVKYSHFLTRLIFFFLSQLWKFSFKVLRLVGFFFTLKRVSNDFRDFLLAYMLSFEISLETPSPPETRTVINQGTYIQCRWKCVYMYFIQGYSNPGTFSPNHTH